MNFPFFNIYFLYATLWSYEPNKTCTNPYLKLPILIRNLILHAINLQTRSYLIVERAKNRKVQDLPNTWVNKYPMENEKITLLFLTLFWKLAIDRQVEVI